MKSLRIPKGKNELTVCSGWFRVPSIKIKDGVEVRPNFGKVIKGKEANDGEP